MICSMTAGADDDKVVTKKTWMTWKAKYAFWVNNSTPEIDGSPANFAQTTRLVSLIGTLHRSLWSVYLRRMMMGTNDMRIARATDGRRPVITPRMTLGISVSHDSQEYSVAR